MQDGIAAWSSGCVRAPVRNSTAATPSSDALCASSGPPTRSPIASTLGAAVRPRASTSTKPRFVHVHARRFEAEVGRERPSADRDQQLIRLDRLGALVRRDGDAHARARLLDAFEARAEPHLDALAAELALEHLGQLGIGAGQHLRRHLEHRHLGAVHRVDVRELDAHGAGAHHDEAIGPALAGERLARGEHALAVHVEAGRHPLASSPSRAARAARRRAARPAPRRRRRAGRRDGRARGST